MRVDIQSKKCIKPATPTPPHLHKLSLSSIDELQPDMFVQLVLHYPIQHKTELQKTPEKLAGLEESLSKILTLYYPFAGRYNNGEEYSAVSCGDQGMEFAVATVDCRLDEVDDDGEYSKEALVSGLQKGVLASSDGAWTVVSVQVNVFTCGGLAIGLSFLHKVSDLFTFASFLNAWSTACRHGTVDQIVPPNFTLSSSLPPKTLKPSANSPPPQSNLQIQKPPRFVTKRFIFTKQAILKLKSAVAENYTRVQLLTALITRALVSNECAKAAKPKPFVMFQTMNLRSRATLPVEENSCGNFYTLSISRGFEKEFWELRDVVELIRKSITETASEVQKVKNWGEFSKKVEEKYVEFYEDLGKGDEVLNMMAFSSWCRLPLHETDFGWGRPSLINTLPSPFAIAHFMDYYRDDDDDGGIEVWMCLKEDDMAWFQHKPDILEYAVFKSSVAKKSS